MEAVAGFSENIPPIALSCFIGLKKRYNLVGTRQQMLDLTARDDTLHILTLMRC